MGCDWQSEVEEEDDAEFLNAAQEDDNLVAHFLIGLSGSGTPLPWPTRRARRSSVASSATCPSPPPVTTWGARRTRSRTITLDGIIAARIEELERQAAAADPPASPATPLSWSGGSATGNSGSESGNGSPSPLWLRKGEAEICYRREGIQAPPSRKLNADRCVDPYPREGVEAATEEAFFRDYRSRNKSHVVDAAEVSTTFTQAELMGSRWTCSSSVRFRCTGKKKDVKQHAEIYHAQYMKLKEVEPRVTPTPAPTYAEVEQEESVSESDIPPEDDDVQDTASNM